VKLDNPNSPVTKEEKLGNPNSSLMKEEKLDNPNSPVTKEGEKALLDKYVYNRSWLREGLTKDCDPRSVDNIDHLRKAAVHLKVMVRVTQYFTGTQILPGE
jgi:hypothetical protein